MTQGLPPAIDDPWAKLACIVAAYVITLSSSGAVVQWVAGTPAPAGHRGSGPDRRPLTVGRAQAVRSRPRRRSVPVGIASKLPKVAVDSTACRESAE